ncbi:hypothetical protein N9S07_01435 [Nitrosomonadales bacterium]|jgi:hypothetical protein|nr:hypothetical protein [Methylophilaceae bacterium]MDA9600421.1 hypothetical protein [Nitrosomonadales bacterium]|tara:strand:- start:42 stop:443 length:402 start_codon:yes stop_codon:yes gene_type:complete
MKIIISLLSIFCISFANADEQQADVENPIIEEMPTDYLEFANVIGLLKPEEIIGLIGEPAKKLDLKMKSSNEVIASSWYYHNLNTDGNGNYFPTTELDIIDGYVESVVFLNDVDENSNFEGKKFDTKQPDSLF